MGKQWHFDPDSYLKMVRSEIPSYDRLQDTLAEATAAVAARRILDLGSGTGVTAQHVLAAHPGASLIGVDSSEDMLAHARNLVPEATFLVGSLEDPLPDGPFDLVVSAFAIHHLDAGGKADLFRRVASILALGGRFVLLDVVVPTQAPPQPVPLEAGIDLPSTVEDQVEWLANSGFAPDVVMVDGDVAVIAAGLRNERAAE